MIKRKDKAKLSNLEKIIISEWLDFIIEENVIGGSIYNTVDKVTYFPTSDGKYFTNEKEAIEHEKEYLINEYELEK